MKATVRPGLALSNQHTPPACFLTFHSAPLTWPSYRRARESSFITQESLNLPSTAMLTIMANNNNNSDECEPSSDSESQTSEGLQSSTSSDFSEKRCENVREPPRSSIDGGFVMLRSPCRVSELRLTRSECAMSTQPEREFSSLTSLSQS